MADHIRKLSVGDVFTVNQMLCSALSEHIEGKGKNAFLPKKGFNKALSAFELPQISEPVSE